MLPETIAGRIAGQEMERRLAGLRQGGAEQPDAVLRRTGAAQGRADELAAVERSASWPPTARCIASFAGFEANGRA